MDFPAQLSPELALVDPELGAWARARLPDGALVIHRPEPLASDARAPERAASPTRRLVWVIERAVLLGVVLFVFVVVAAMVAHEVRAAPAAAGYDYLLLPCP
jgi:hypothetical protein